MVIEGGVLKEARVQGRPIEPQREYRLALNNFSAGGGDGYPKLSDHPGHVNTGLVDADVLRAFIAAGSPLKAVDFIPPADVVRR
jgi:5'-nucleotidase / UDP-sugar diphosphatase